MYGPRPAGHWTREGGTDGGRSYRSLRAGQRYRVAKQFLDFDGDNHPVGEEWIFRAYSYLPYDDGLSLIVSLETDEEWLVPLQDRLGAQGDVVTNLDEYVVSAPVPECRVTPNAAWEHVNATVLAFADWDKPWTFQPFVAGNLLAPARRLFDEAWQVALGSAHWRVSDLATGAHEADVALRNKFHELNPAATRAIARAAAYQWR